MSGRHVLLILTCIALSACASKFPSPEWAVHSESSPNGVEIFTNTFNTHGGESLDQLNDVNVSITGKWKKLIRKIQPLVTDFNYRVDSQERLLPQARIYAALYRGPGGTKKVIRTPDSIDVYYNDLQSTQPDVMSSTALTADSFHLFLLASLALEPWRNQFTRLTDETENDTRYYRIHVYRTPGFGFSTSDEVVLWINQQTNRTYKVQITLEGHSTTKGAHVEVAYLDYEQRGAYLFPSKFIEKVNAPVALNAHAWTLTGLDINRDLRLSDLTGKGYSKQASVPAKEMLTE